MTALSGRHMEIAVTFVAWRYRETFGRTVLTALKSRSVVAAGNRASVNRQPGRKSRERVCERVGDLELVEISPDAILE